MASHELSGLIRYLGQDDWGACFDEVLEQHLGPALDAAEVSFDDLKEILRTVSPRTTLPGCGWNSVSPNSENRPLTPSCWTAELCTTFPLSRRVSMHARIDLR
ncbi:hypothetical protein [Acidomonas methanolica]|uniref:hypothetical protein n=1 Tax=Acidomonas methanolica TaxID=437 RepID=UPI00211A4052|nr:hypothetical protein [Acidomonas methanolica]MCQ9157090.1 hypothetical protein [Acidomonas methanolica]